MLLGGGGGGGERGGTLGFSKPLLDGRKEREEESFSSKDVDGEKR